MNYSKSTEIAKNKIIALMLNDISPLAYKACEDVVKPLITDIDKLPAIYRLIEEMKPFNNENMAFYCAVILRLYSPAHLYLDGFKLPVGYRDRFSKQFGFNSNETWNYWAEPVRAMMKNSRFASAVNGRAIEIDKFLKRNGDLLTNTTD